MQGEQRSEIEVEALPVDDVIVDIGHRTVERYTPTIGSAATIFANGPLGVFEEPSTEYGTKAIWMAMASAPGHSAIGGGDSISAMVKFGLADQFDYVCTAGGGMVRFMSGEMLPVVSALKAAVGRSYDDRHSRQGPGVGDTRVDLGSGWC